MNNCNFNNLRIRTVAMPRDTNPAGNIFGGWILSQIDLAGAIAAREVAPERVVTMSMKEVVFKEPIFVGDTVSCYSKIINIGKTSITTLVEVTVERLDRDNMTICKKVTTAEIVYVSVDRLGHKKIIDLELKKSFGF